MQVYVLLIYTEHEGSEIEGVYATRRAAEKAKQALGQADPFKMFLTEGNEVHIEVFDVQEDCP